MKIRDILAEADENKTKTDTSKEESDVEMYEDLGTFVALGVDRLSSRKIKNFSEDFDIANPVPEEDLHVTLIMTDDFMKGFEPQGVLEDPYMINGFELEVWQTSDGDNVLVAKFEDEQVEGREDAIRRQWPDIQNPYDEFIPHITISYDSQPEDELDLQRLTYRFNEYVDWVSLNNEYVEPLEMDDDDD